MASARSWETLTEARVDLRHGFFRLLITHKNTERRGREGQGRGQARRRQRQRETETPNTHALAATLSQDHFAIGRLCIFPSMRFQGACSFNTQKFAQLLDSKVKISKNQNDHNRERRGQRTGRGQDGEGGGQKARKKRRDQQREK